MAVSTALIQLAAFVGVSAVVIVTPGPDTALTVRNTLAGGRRSGIMTALGVGLGQSVWTVAASVGIAAVLRASEPTFLALRIGGGAYLAVLGVQALAAAVTRRGHSVATAHPIRRVHPAAALRQGLISNLGNPKMAVFFTSLLPQFAPGGPGSFAGLFVLGLLFCLMTISWLSGYAIALAKARQLFSRSRFRRMLDGLTGAVLVAFGIRLATEHR
jgi:threonine/homoserine/homoserine lactone efflux protein